MPAIQLPLRNAFDFLSLTLLQVLALILRGTGVTLLGKPGLRRHTLLLMHPRLRRLRLKLLLNLLIITVDQLVGIRNLIDDVVNNVNVLIL